MAKGRKTGGRRKGVPNRDNGEIKDMLREALKELGGVKYLVGAAVQVPQAFLGLIAKLIPNEVRSELTHHGDLTIQVITGVAGEPGIDKRV